MNARNKLALALAAAALAAAVAWALRPRPVPVETALVTRGVFERSVTDEGKTRVRDRYVVSAPLAGHLERILLKAGDTLKAGESVAVLHPSVPAFLDARTAREFAARLGAAEAQQARARAETARLIAQRAQARSDLARQKKLAEEGFVSDTAREQAELALASAERLVEAANFAEDAAGHEVQQARAALVRYRAESSARTPGSAVWEVKAPVSGRVLKIVQQSEGPVAAGAPLVEIADPRSLEAVIEVLSQESVAIRPGMPARVELGEGLAVPARVRLVEPEAFTKVSALGVEEQRVNVVLDLEGPLERLQTVGDAFRVEATIVTQRLENAVKVPLGAVFREGRGWAVFTVQDARAAKRSVVLPLRNSAEALVQRGLKPGETVVVYPPDALKDGARVSVRRAG